MKKLKLQIENLVVESFQVSGNGADGRGTVAAHMPKPTEPPFAETQITGSCCDITLALSCVQTNCFEECFVLTADPCA
jgi:hypothetical protein